MLSNFEKFKSIVPDIYENLINLESDLNISTDYFSLRLRKTTEMVVGSDKLKGFFPPNFRFINLGDSFNHLFDMKNFNKLCEITKSRNNANQLRNSLYDIKNFLNKPLHHQANNDLVSEILNLDKNGKISLLQKMYSILSLIYFGNNGLDFSYEVYFNLNFISDLELKNYFKKFLDDNGLKEKPNNFLRFLTTKVIDEFYDNEHFEFKDLIDGETLVESQDSVLLKFFDSTINKNNILLLKVHNKKSIYSLENFKEDVSKIEADINFKFDNQNKTDKKLFIVAPTIDDRCKSEILKHSLNMGNLSIVLFNEKDILNEYKFKNNEELSRDIKLELKTTNSFFQIKGNSYDIFVAQILATSIAKAWEKTKGQILKKNLRGYIRSSKIDGDIRKTIKEDSSNFVIYNNGLTAVAKNKSDFNSGKYIKFDELYIINGGQTTRLLSDSINNSKDRYKYKDLSVLMKIIVPHNEAFNNSSLINKISISSNRQKPIKSQDLWSNNTELIKWSKNFNLLNLEPYKFGLKRESLKKNENQIIVNLPMFLQLMTATLWADPVLAKNGKSRIFEYSEGYIVGKTFKKLNLQIKDVQYFIYDILLLNDLIDDYAKNLKKMVMEESKRKNLIKILTTGKFFIIETIYIIHMIKNTNYDEKVLLLKNLNSNRTTQEGFEMFKNLSDKSNLSKIINRKEYFEEESKVSQISESILNNLKNLISYIIYALADNRRWAFLSKDSNAPELDWIGVFKNRERGWEFIIPFIKDFLNVELGHDDNYLESNAQRLTNLINSCIV